MHQWIILSVVAVLLVFVIVYLIWDTVRKKLPDGRVITKKSRGFTVNCIVHKDVGVVSHKALANACLDAIMSLVAASRVVVHKGSISHLKEFNVWIIPEKYYNVPHSAAYITKVHGIPTCVTTPGYYREIIYTGEPVIHEACHAILDDYVGDANDHEDDTIWAARGKTMSIQAVAHKLFNKPTDD